MTPGVVDEFSRAEIPLGDFFDASDELLAALGEGAEPLVLTENCKPVAVLEDIAGYHQKRETLALLRLLALAKEDIAPRRVHPVVGLLDRICERRNGSAWQDVG